MPRRSRIVVPGCAHHVTQRGNHRADVFRDDADRFHYIRLLHEHATAHDVWLWTYTLMTNHIHLIVVPQSATALSEAFRNAHSIYGRWFNKKYGLSGHLWQGRFYSCVLSESHLWAAVRYVERNPVRAGIVDRAEDYRWSSAYSCARKIGPASAFRIALDRSRGQLVRVAGGRRHRERTQGDPCRDGEGLSFRGRHLC